MKLYKKIMWPQYNIVATIYCNLFTESCMEIGAPPNGMRIKKSRKGRS